MQIACHILQTCGNLEASKLITIFKKCGVKSSSEGENAKFLGQSGDLLPNNCHTVLMNISIKELKSNFNINNTYACEWQH